MKAREKLVGVLGGMGPEATSDFFAKVIRATPAARDQEHLQIIINNNPKIPDRTAAACGNGTSPLPMMVESARVLEKAGVDFIVIPCVTAHYFHAGLQRQIGIPILNIVEETIDYLITEYPDVKTVGVLATTATLKTNLFDNVCAKFGIAVLKPAEEIQTSRVVEAIFGFEGIKAKGPCEGSRKLMLEAAQTLIDLGAQAIIAGCTEVPLVLKDGDLSVPVLDTLGILAARTVAFAMSNAGNAGEKRNRG
jgi:aspartate racemase